eukprot:TRINITY_DN432_c0_g1_i1.p1 TRINITY_DN432_c0_g1~~TRINITY_DN432_c0_g1_i1.p1  ORF type:complete len:423 (+),score=72.34 TRINITY_DN432_c0_g1_i1:189-1457(+)
MPAALKCVGFISLSNRLSGNSSGRALRWAAGSRNAGGYSIRGMEGGSKRQRVQNVNSISTVTDYREGYSTQTLPPPTSPALMVSMADEITARTSVLPPATLSPARAPSKTVCLFFYQEMEELAKAIASGSDNIELNMIKWGQFESGFPNLFIPNAYGIRGRHVAFLASFSSPSVIFEQLSVIYALPRMFVSSFTLVLPFFPTGTMERMEDEGDVATANTLSRILSNIPMSRGGPTSLVIFDIHALQERFYFGDSVMPCFESGVPLLRQRLKMIPNVSIAFPDDGAWKRFHRQLQHYPTIICTKVREGDKRIIKLKEGDPEGRHVVIVDDLVNTGATLIECQKLLTAKGAAYVSAYCTHGVFPQETWKRFVPEEKATGGGEQEHGFAHFWITDSCAQTVKAVRGRQPFEILSLADAIRSALQT